MYTLYHNLASTCSQKVRWTFAEKDIEFESKEIDLLAGEQHQDWYCALNPNRVVPTLVHDGEVILESSLINLYLEDIKPEPRLLPETPLARYRVRHWIHRIDHDIHPVAPILTFAIGPRKFINLQPPEVREENINKIVDPVAREQRRSVLDHGIEAPEFRNGLGVFVKLLDDMDQTLQQAQWLAGEGISLADGTALPYVLRLHHLGMDAMVDERPALADWLLRVQARASYHRAVEQWMPQEIVDMLRANGSEEWPAIQSMLRSL